MVYFCFCWFDYFEHSQPVARVNNRTTIVKNIDCTDLPKNIFFFKYSVLYFIKHIIPQSDNVPHILYTYIMYGGTVVSLHATVDAVF
jgi:hypothetical protein